ncbi:electron transfer flavoprotein subunit alpha/FixB family protein [Arcanobacterium phocae]|uniref:Electron transfer flavoprotein alpha subunit apoprotein n=1 Tax=Arcanobacterium phocae TaxID=131112 RepID=A0A1H2LMF2_9ACTO|nr:electron transfer flavoprotein subunit alpha/FixB family protein [Arcanobacterium phocae]SDU82099.1 electron transfer flavoprotein alpha subunit apoprotein [Arcanobacterium phocae]
MSTTWIVTTTGAISDLVALGKNRGDTITAVVVGDAAVADVDSVIRIPQQAGQPAEVLAPAVSAAVTAGIDDVILTADLPAERVLAGAVAAKLNAPVLVSVRQLGTGTAQVARFGAITLETVEFTGPVVALYDGGAELTGPAGDEATVDCAGYSAQVIAEDISDTPRVDISRAERVVCAGRGFENKEDLQLAQDLADVLGAEMGVSRPLAEGYGWVRRDNYIGISGQIIAPELYIAVGISGQIHHTAGVTDSQTIVAINNDELATMFDFADYGIVGDLYQVLPELTAALQK